MHQHTAEQYGALFTESTGPIGAVREGVHGYRVKRILAGETLEIEAYAIWSTEKSERKAREATEKHRDAVRAVHLRDRQKHMRRLINTNFGTGDLLLTLTYDRDRQPEDEIQAGKDIRAFIRRLRRLREKLGLAPLKYVYTTECTHGMLGTRYHHHLIVNGGIQREAVEGLWHSGNVNSRIARADQYGLSGWAHYITKQKITQEKASKRGFTCSRNLVKPTVTSADHKLSRAKMQRMAADMEQNGREILERLYPAYVLTERPEVKWSPFVEGVYLSARFIRRKEQNRQTIL